MTWVPFDATEDEITELLVLREGIPRSLRMPLYAWLALELRSPRDNRFADVRLIHALQSALRIELTHERSGFESIDSALNELEAYGDAQIIRAVDYLASRVKHTSSDTPDRIASLNKLLIGNSSAYECRFDGTAYRIALRVPSGVRDITQSVAAADAQAGGLLLQAWNYAYGLDVKPAEAMDSAVRAVEALAIQLFAPKATNATLGTAISTMRDQGNWTHGLRDKTNKAPAQLTIYYMLQTLWEGQEYRHVNRNAQLPTVEQARTHVQLASTLVGWLSGGNVYRDNLPS